MALHPLKVEEQEVLQFPPVESTIVESGDFEREINDLRSDIRELQQTVNELKDQPSNDTSMLSYVAIGLGIIGIVIAIASFAKRK